jgi:hypothetical protein
MTLSVYGQPIVENTASIEWLGDLLPASTIEALEDLLDTVVDWHMAQEDCYLSGLIKLSQWRHFDAQASDKKTEIRARIRTMRTALKELKVGQA